MHIAHRVSILNELIIQNTNKVHNRLVKNPQTQSYHKLNIVFLIYIIVHIHCLRFI